MTHTTISHPDGTTTTITARSSDTCAGCLWGCLLLFVITAPAGFGPLAIPAYCILAALAVVYMRQRARRRS